MIRIICFGKIKEKYLDDGINDYLKRLSKYHKLEIIELKDNEDILQEEKQMLKYLDNKSYNIALAIEGDKLSSVELSKTIDNCFNNYGTINFLIGSSNGLSETIKNSCNKLISFGNITMPHGLFRLILLEQIYRSFKILNHESYHK